MKKEHDEEAAEKTESKFIILQRLINFQFSQII